MGDASGIGEWDRLFPPSSLKKKNQKKQPCKTSTVGFMIWQLLKSTSIGQKAKKFYLIIVMAWRSTCRCPESCTQVLFCACILRAKILQCFGVKTWCPHHSMYPGFWISVCWKGQQSKSKLCGVNSESGCSCPSVVTPVCFFVDRVLPAGKFLKENTKCEHCWSQLKNTANGFCFIQF